MAWITLKRYDDGLEAEIARNFLREHGLNAALRGNSGASSILNRFDTVIDIRLEVPEDEAEHAREALEALEPDADAMVHEPPLSGEGYGGPYREGRAHPRELADDDEPLVKPRYKRAAFVLAFALPIGSGHFYARHGFAGAIFAMGIAGYFTTGVVRGDRALIVAALALVVVDAVLAAAFAVKRFNEGRPFSPRQQAGLAAVGLVAAMGAGLLFGGHGDVAGAAKRPGIRVMRGD